MKKHLSLYVIGFILSILLTILAYQLVVSRFGDLTFLVVCLVVLALGQFVVQLLFFLRLGNELGPRWRLFAFLFMLLVVFILVGGSIWIMSSLNYQMNLNPAQVNQYLNSQDGF